MDNRREHDRIDTTLALEIFNGEQVVLAVSMNLSVGGVGVNMDSPLPSGRPVELSLFLVEDGIEDERTPPLGMKGEVVWCKNLQGKQYTAGIRFVGMTQEQRHSLEHFLGRLS